jgi:phage gp36-like protein
MIAVKQPAETLVEQLPFAAPVVSVGPATSVSRGLVPGSAPLTAPLAIVTGGAATIAVSGGTDGERYLVTVRGADAAGETLEAELEVAVVDASWTMPDGGVAYLTIAEFVDLFGLDEVVQMTDRTGAGRIDRTYLVAALRAAQSTADLNLAARYAVPIAIVPDAIKTAIADLARARLYPRGAPDGVAQAAKDANATLARIASGALPLPLPAGATAASADSTAPVYFTPGKRQYPDGLSDY